MQLSIIIVNFNVKYFLEHCLLSVINACNGIEAEIFVVDNNSSDGSREYLEPKFPQVRFIWNPENLGFAKANNSVLHQAKGEHILFLNPDTIVPEDCFMKCLAFFRSHDDCGALGVRMIDGSGKFLPESKRSLPTASSGFYKMFGPAKWLPDSKIFAKYYAGQIPEKENHKVQVLSGAFMMLSKKALDKAKGFDEDFFMYGEDIDLSYRITKAGLSNYYVGEISIVHFKGESTQKMSAAYRQNFYGAIKLFINKHYHKEKIKHAAMGWVISSGKMLAGINKALLLNKPLATPEKYIKTIMVGIEIQDEEVTNLLMDTNYIVNKIFVTRHDFSVNQLQEMIKEQKADAVIFCKNDSFSYSDIITWLQQMSGKIHCLFYTDYATSIIGSNDKNERGIFIAKTE